MTSLLLSPTFSANKKPLISVNLPDRAYVLSIVSLPGHYAAAASSPSDAIHLFDRANFKTIVKSLPGHRGGISCIKSAPMLLGRSDVLLSCGRDGVVRIWDERTGEAGVQMSTSGRAVPLLSCDAASDGRLVAAGTVMQSEDASVLYWDPRSPAAPLRRHSSTHSDDITAVHFDKRGTTEVLLTTSTDGLICTSNPNEEDEDEAGIHVANWGCSVSKAGWLSRRSDDAPQVWASSDMETLSLWNKELDPIADFDRERFGYTNPQLPWQTDYLIDILTLSDGSFRLFTGSNEGDVALIKPSTTIDKDSRWSLEQVFSTGHSEIIRSVLLDENSGVLMTGGEDSRLNVWRCSTQSSEIPRVREDSMDVDSESPPRKRIYGN